MEFIKFACPQCGALLPLPVGSVTKCKYCNSTVAVEEGANAGSKENARLVGNLREHSYLIPSFEHFSDSYYNAQDASAVVHHANVIESRLLESYATHYKEYAFDPSSIAGILSDLSHMVTDIIDDVISSEELSVRDFEQFKWEFFICRSSKIEDKEWDSYNSYEMNRWLSLEDQTHYNSEAENWSRIEFPVLSKKVFLKYQDLIWTGEAISAKTYGDGFEVAKGLIPTTAYLVRFLYFPISTKDKSEPRLELFKDRPKATKYLTSLLEDMVELRKNWMRENEEIEYLLESIWYMFEPYTEGILRKKNPDMEEFQKSIGNVWHEFKNIKNTEPKKRLQISL